MIREPLSRRSALTVVIAMAFCGPEAIAQQPYPAGRTIKVVVGFAPGGTSDIVGRIVADRLAASWAVPVVVENVAGANGNTASERVAKGPPDGSQLLIVTTNIATNAFLYSRLSYDPERDLQPVASVARLTNLLLIKKDLPANSVGEFIAYAKANAGKLNYASPGKGSSPHLSAELFKRMTGTDLTAVTYRGSGPALTDLVAGNVDVMFDNITSSISLVREAKIRALAVTSAQRSALATEYPPIGDTVPGYDVSTFFGIAVRAGTPNEIVSRIEAATIAIARDPTVKERLAAIAAEPVGSTAVEFTSFIAKERARWGKAITDLGIRIE